MNNLNRVKKYVSHASAAKLWDIPNIDNIIGDKNTNKGQGVEAVEITVLEPKLNYARKGHKVHLCNMPLPRGAVTEKNGILVASPEMVFLQLARKLDIHELIFLGLQLCSHKVGKASEAISTKRKLKGFLERSTGYDGSLKAKRAINYIENGAASVREAITFMILTLPYRLGGFGLAGARFNQEIPLDLEGMNQLHQKKCYADIFYPSEKIAVEYDSFTHHSSVEAQGKDSVRTLVLKRLGINVISLKTIQLNDEKLCKEFAQNLAST